MSCRLNARSTVGPFGDAVTRRRSFPPAWSRRSVACSALPLAFLHSVAYAQLAVDRVLVRADRLPSDAAAAPFTVQVISGDEVARAPQFRLDDVLRSEVPGFSLFRRNSSRVAHPTTQGVTLRNFGPNGAGRTLILLDGIPLNDPFAGYVLWNQVPPSLVDNIMVQSGGGAGLFGNVAIAGTIFITSDPITKSGGDLDLTIGSHDTWAIARTTTLVHHFAGVSLHTERFSTGGYPVIEASRRGRRDTKTSADSSLLQLATAFQLTQDVTLHLGGRRFFEERSNGTVYTRNETIGGDGSVALITRLPQLEAELALSGYGQRRRFRSTFSSVEQGRDDETPALDQYDVPANAAGGSAVWQMALGAEHRLTLGSDFRWVEGETNEAFRWSGTEFTRLRNAGGRQLFLGVFAEETWQFDPAVTIVGAARLDQWRLFDGMRVERDRQTGDRLQEYEFPNRDGMKVNGRLGAEWKLTQALAVRAAGYSGFRVPTLNELYRPFRVGNDITEANPQLEPEQLLGGEIGANWQAHESVQLGSVVFLNSLHDAIGNVTIGHGPGIFDPGGFVPAGGVLRQRRNIDHVVAPGIELTAVWQVAPQLRWRTSYIFTHATIDEAEESALEGNRLAQTPEHVVVGGMEWQPFSALRFIAQTRYISSQFEDDDNSRKLGSYTTVDLALDYQITKQITAAVKVENVFDIEIETGKTADGITQIGMPRLVTLQIRTVF